MQAVQMELFEPPKEIPIYEIMEAKRERIMSEEWAKLGDPNALNIREYVRACELRFDKELGESYDERYDERLDDNDILGECFNCGREITAGMMRRVDAICYSWTHKDGSPVTARLCWGNKDCHDVTKDPVWKCECDWIHKHYLRLCGLTEAEYREKLKREQPTVYEARVKSGYYKDVL